MCLRSKRLRPRGIDPSRETGGGPTTGLFVPNRSNHRISAGFSPEVPEGILWLLPVAAIALIVPLVALADMVDGDAGAMAACGRLLSCRWGSFAPWPFGYARDRRHHGPARGRRCRPSLRGKPRRNRIAPVPLSTTAAVLGRARDERTRRRGSHDGSGTRSWSRRRARSLRRSHRGS